MSVSIFLARSAVALSFDRLAVRPPRPDSKKRRATYLSPIPRRLVKPLPARQVYFGDLGVLRIVRLGGGEEGLEGDEAGAEGEDAARVEAGKDG